MGEEEEKEVCVNSVGGERGESRSKGFLYTDTREMRAEIIDAESKDDRERR